MNTKTTVVLALIAAAITCYVTLVQKPWEAKQTEVEAKSNATALFDTKFEDADRVEVQREDGKKLVFVKDAETKAWTMQEPVQAPAAGHQVQSILDKIADIKYLHTYAANDKDRPSGDVSGLDKPDATVRIVKGDKELANITIGSGSVGKSSFVKKVGSDEVMDTLARVDVEPLKAKIDSFRDKNVMKFDLNDVKRMKVEGLANYTLVKNGEDWVIESPVRSRADKGKAESAVRALSSLFVADFKDDAPAAYKPYQLDPARLKVTVETEKKIPPKAKPGDPNTQPADIEPTTKQVTYELQVGGAVDQAGKQFFARLGDRPWVFSVNDNTVTQLTPQLTDLQDKKLAKVDSAKMKSVKVETADGSVLLTKQEDGKWVDGDNQVADALAVEDLLKAVSGLEAVQFVDPATELVKVDWEKPRARVTLTEEGSLTPATVLVGPASASGKMVFVRNAAEEPVAAVHDDAVAQLVAGPVAYRDRAVMKFDRPRASKLEISQAGKDKIVLTQKANRWSMVEPVLAIVDFDAVRNLMQDLSNMQAKRVAGSGDKARFGLDKPEVTLAVYVDPIPNAVVASAPAAATVASQPAASQPATRPAKTLAEQIKDVEGLIEFQKTNPQENKLATDMLKKRLAELKNQVASQPAEAAQASAAGEPTAATATSKPAEPMVLKLELARKDGKVYAAVDGKPMIYELDNQVFTDVTAELHSRDVVKFDSANVGEVEFTAGDTAVTLRKTGEDWKYVLDPVLPIDKEKVTKALDDVKDVKTHKYVSYKADLAQYGLAAPASKFSVLAGAQRTEVLISAKGPTDDADKSVYAAVAGTDKVFLLKAEQVTKLNRKLDEFEKSSTDNATEKAPQMPGGQHRPMPMGMGQ